MRRPGGVIEESRKKTGVCFNKNVPKKFSKMFLRNDYPKKGLTKENFVRFFGHPG